jgi:Plasmid encoded RepA protein
MKEDPCSNNRVHQLVLIYGRERARELVSEKQRPLINIASEVMADESQKIGITYAGFCLTSLPHKRLADDQAWTKQGHKVTLMVEPGRMMVRKRTVLYGVPYGARARMILLFLQGQAIRTGSREIELGRSLSAWMERMGIAWGGETARAIREQAARISACSLKFFWEDEQAEGWAAGRIVNSGLRFNDIIGEGTQGSLWEDHVVLDETFFKALKEHPVPLQEAAIRELRDRSMSLDIYVWLAWRLHSLAKGTPISWGAVHQQFGSGYAKLFHFKPGFTESLAAALAAYPQARVDVDETGIVLHPSHPPVSKLSAKALAIG